MSINDTFNFSFSSTFTPTTLDKFEHSNCKTRSIIPNGVTYTFTAITTIILVAIFSVSIRNSVHSKRERHDKPWSDLQCGGKVKRVWREFRDRKKLLGKMAAHLADQVTDLGVALEFYFLWKQHTPCKEVSTLIFFILSMITFCGFRVISAVYIGITLKSWKHFALQLFDSEIYYTIYMSITHQKYQTFKVQEYLYLIEAVTESVPQSMLQIVFLLQTELLFSTNAKLINASLVFTVISIIIKVSEFNFPEVEPKCNIEKFLQGKLYSAMNWNYVWVHIYQTLLTTSTIFLIGLLWRIIGGMYVMVLFYVALIVFFIFAIVLLIREEFELYYNIKEKWLRYSVLIGIVCGLAVFWSYAMVCVLLGVTYPEKNFVYFTHYIRIVIHIVGFLFLIIFGIVKFDSDNDYVPDYKNRKLLFTADSTELGLFIYILFSDILWIILFMILTERNVIQTSIANKSSDEELYDDLNKYKNPKEIIKQKESIILCNYTRDELMKHVLLYGNIEIFLKECEKYMFETSHITFALENSNTEDSRYIFKYFVNNHSYLLKSMDTKELNENVALLFNIHNLSYFKYFETFCGNTMSVPEYKHKDNDMLHYACMNPNDTNCLEFLQFLLETHNLNPNCLNSLDHLPLEILIINTNNWRSFEYLWHKTDKTEIYNKYWDIYTLCHNKRNKTLFNYFKTLPIDFNLVLHNLIIAKKKYLQQLYNILTQLFENIELFKYNLTNNKSTTIDNCYSFHIACKHTKLKIVQLFINLDPLILTYPDKNSKTMINYAKTNNNEKYKNEIVNYLKNLAQNDRFHSQSISLRNILNNRVITREKSNDLIQLPSLETKRQFENHGIKLNNTSYHNMKQAGFSKEEILEQQTLIDNALGKNEKKNRRKEQLEEQIQLNMEDHLDNLQNIVEE